MSLLSGELRLQENPPRFRGSLDLLAVFGPSNSRESLRAMIRRLTVDDHESDNHRENRNRFDETDTDEHRRL